MSFVIPKGHAKEKIKLFFYNLTKPKRTRFHLEKREGQTIFKITYDGIGVFTREALYPTSDDFSFYQHFYKAKKEDVVIDAGANMGHIAIFLSQKVGTGGKVYCFEPDKFNIQYLKENLSLNRDLPDNIVIEELLLWNENVLVDFEETGTVGSSAIWFSGTASLTKKQAVTLDDWAEEKRLHRLDYIKMDIEGAEIEAIKGCQNIIKKFKPNFAIASYHVVNGKPTYLKLEEFFKKINYPCKTIAFKGNEIITFAGPAIG